ncbi:DUF7507 domain-containing protein [Bradyrhizobium genosp. P]|uniref:beta strand repeat-containing protein n=1 Tax=Bradyrhizobium genosp. P TaxID=83641 RepID=UPI003CFB8897
MTKPLTDQAVTVNLGYDQKVKVDFSGIAKEKITLVHIGEKLIILFDNNSTVTVEPFFDSRHDALQNLTIETTPGREVSVSDFVSLFPITTDSSVLPAADNGGASNANAQASGAHFSDALVDPLPPVPTNQLAPPEVLPNFVIELPTGIIPITTLTVANATIVKSFTTTPTDPADAGQADHAGQVIGYKVVVTNTGNETLTGMTVTDSQGNILTGGSTTLAVGASETLTGTHIVTQAEIDAGKAIVNTATLTDSQGVAGASTVTTQIDQIPGVSIVKSFTTAPTDPADAGQADQAGQLINYSVVVTNTGNETLTGVTVSDPNDPNLQVSLTTLAPGQSETLTGSVVATQAEINAGTPIVNTATVTDTQGVTSSFTVSTPVEDHAAVSLVKSFTTTPSFPGNTDPANTVDQAGQLINYSVVVTNTGNETLTGVTVSDPNDPNLQVSLTTLAPGQSETLTGSVVATQAEINAGTPIVNTATVTDTQGVTSSFTVSTPVEDHAAVSLVKSFTTTPSFPGNTDPANTVDQAGQLINYSVVVTNTGNETLTGVTVSDPNDPNLQVSLTTLAPGQSETLTGSVVATQAEINAGTPIVNTATVTDTQGVTSSFTVSTPVEDHAAVSLVKSFTTTPSFPGNTDPANTVDQAGQLINYSVVVTNTGNETLTGVTVSDPNDPNLQVSLTTLAPGQSETLTGSVVATQAEINADTPIVNTATVTDTQGVTSSFTVSTPVEDHAAVSLVKSFTTTPSFPGNTDPANTVDQAGQLINYSVVVTNTGNETLTGVTVSDPNDPNLQVSLTTLAPGQSETLTGSVVATQAEINAGTPIVNTATVTDTQGVTSSFTVSTPVEDHAAVSLVKSFTTTPSFPGNTDPANTVDQAGQLINYSVVVTNTGNETLTGVTVSDPNDPNLQVSLTTLAPGQSETLTGSVVATQAEINAGTPIVNTATVTDTQGVTSSFTVSTPVEDHAAVSLVKSFTTTPSFPGNTDPANTVDQAGQLINYSVVVTNTGNETLTGVTVSDPNDPNLQVSLTTLAPGQSETLTGSVVATQAEINADTPIVNTATVTDTQGVTSSFTVSTPVEDHAAVSLVKSFTTTPSFPGNTDPANTVDQAGQLINYSVVVTNTGNETLTGVTVSDPNDPNLQVSLTTLAPGQSETLTGSVVATQAEINAGTPIVNTATVTDTQGVTSSFTVSTPVEDHAAVSLVKSFTTTPSFPGNTDPANTVDQAGQLINYSVVVTNTGNETLTGVTVSDPNDPNLQVSLTTLAPGQSETLTGSVVATQAEINAGTPIVNTATVTDTQGVTSSFTVSTPVEDHAAVSLVKSFTTTPSFPGNTDPANTVDQAGQLINYSVVVTNTGNETLTGVTVSDPNDPNLQVSLTTLAPGQSETLTGSVVATQAEINADTPIVNTATVTDTQGVTSSFTVSTPVEDHAAVSLVKSFTTTPSFPGNTDPANTVDQAGQLINYSVVVTNTGNETLTGVTVSDPNDPNLQVSLTTLAPGQSETLTGSVVATQAEINAGTPIVNTATVTDTQGVTSSFTVSTPVEDHAAVSLVKSFTTTPSFPGNTDPANTVDQAGQLINYSVVVTNTGNETLTGVTVSDPNDPNLQVSLTTLAPGQSETLTGSVVATQAEINAGTPIVNTATVTDTQGVTSSFTVSTPVEDHAAVSLVKSFTTTPSFPGNTDPANTVDQAGQLINYSVVVTNTGNETLTGVTVSDPNDPNLQVSLTTLAPGQSETLTGSVVATQAEINAGTPIVNTATVTDTQGVTSSFTVSTPVEDHAAVSLVKSFTTTPSFPGNTDPANTVDQAGQLINYSVVVTNTGNETLTGVTVSDPNDPNLQVSLTTLAPGQSETLTGSVVATQAEINAGTPIVNTATVTDTQGVTSSFTVSTPVEDHAAVSLVKSFTTTPSFPGNTDPANTVDQAGQLINYSVVVTNTGNETLTGVTVSDPNDPNLQVSLTTLAPGQSETLTGSVVATQAEINADTPIVNTATVTDTQGVTSSFTVSTPVEDHAAVSLVKSFTTTPSFPGNTDPANTVDQAGQLINYSVVVTNTGNETLTGVTVSDPNDPNLQVSLTTLAPGQSETLTGSVVATQAEINAGTPIVNTATVTDTQGVTSSFTVSTPVEDHAAVSLVKSFTTTPSFPGNTDPANTVDQAGQLINYSVVVTNTGNETLTGVTVSDPNDPNLQVSLTTLAPGQSETLTGSVVATQAEINAGTPIVNTATVTDTQGVTSSFTVSTPVEDHAAVSLVKSFTTTPSFPGNTDPANTVDQAGQLINYSVVVTNTGNETLTGVTVSDPNDPNLQVSLTTLAPGQSETLTGSVVATQAEINADTPIVNTATVTDTQGVTSSFTVSTPVEDHAAVSLVKSFTTTPSFPGNTDPANTVDQAGQLINYSVVVTNTGNETLTGVTVSDPNDPNLQVSLTTLAPGQSETLTGSVVATQAEINAGTPIVNTATVTDTQGVTSSFTVSTPVEQHAPTESGAVALTVYEAALSTVPKPNDIEAAITTGTTPLATTETAQSGVGNLLTFTAGTDNITGIVFGTVSGIVVNGSTLPSADFFWDVNGSGQLEGHIGSLTGPLGIILAISGTTTAAAYGGTATPTITATLTDAFPMPTGPAGTVSISVTGIQVIAETDGIHDTSNPGAVSVTIVDDTPSIGAIQNVVMPNVINTDAHGTWQPNFDADGPNLTNAIGIAMGTAPAGETFTVTDTHTTVGGHEIFQVAVTGPANYTFYEYTTYTASTQTGEMLAFTDSTASANPFFTLSMNANGTYVFDLENNSFLSTQTFSVSGATPNGNGEFVEVNPAGTGAYGSGAIPAPSAAFPLIIDGFTTTDTNPADHRVFKDTNGFGVDQSNLQVDSTLSFNFLSQQSDVSMVAGKATVTETATVTLFDNLGHQLAAETINLTPNAAHQITINVDAADWVGTGANAFQNFYTVDIENTGTSKFNPLSLTYNETTVISGTTLTFAPTITDGDGDTATGGNLSVALTAANGGGGYTLTGTGGDVFVASAHADTFTGTGTGNTVDYSNAPSAVTINLGTDTVSGGGVWSVGDTLSDIQNAVGSNAGGNSLTGLAAGGSLLIGEGSGNILTGQGSGNILVGGTGSDTLNGSLGGHDIFALQGTGGSLNDTINNFSSTDEIVVDVGSQSINFGNAQTISTAGAISASQLFNGAPSNTGVNNSFFIQTIDASHHDLWYSPDGTAAHAVDLAHLGTGVPTAAQIHVH